MDGLASGVEPPPVDHRRLPAASAAGAAIVLALAGIVVVSVLPGAASVLPAGDRPEPNAAQLAVTSLGMLLLTGAGLWWVAQTMGATTAWLGLALAYNAGIVVVKFILSPAAYHNAPETTLAQYVWVGVAVMVLYAAGLAAVYVMARRHRAPRVWTWASKLTLVIGLLAFAMASRILAAVALDRAAAEYLGHVFRGTGLWLPALIVGLSLLAVETFDAAAHPPAGGSATTQLQMSLVTGLALIAVYHGLWALYMVRLFS